MVPRAPPSSRVAVAALAVLLCLPIVLGFVGSTDAAPPPRPVCAGCGDAFEERAFGFGVSVAVENSTATVTVDGNGTGTWVVRNALGDGAPVDRLRENATLRTELADVRYWDVEVLSAEVSSDGVFTARYRDGDFARESVAGTMVSGALTDDYGSGYRNLHGLGADRLVVVAPDGMRVGQTPPGASRTADGRRTVLTEYEGGGFVTFVPADAPLGADTGWFAIASVLGPVAVLNGLVSIAVPTAVVGLLVRGGAPAIRTVDPARVSLSPHPGRTLTVLGGLGFVATLLAGALGLARPLTATVFGVSVVAAVGGVAWSRLGTGGVTHRRVCGVAAVGACLGALSAAVGSVLFSGHLPVSARSHLPLFLALFAFVPAGFALRRGHYRRGVSVAAAGVAVALVSVVPLTVNYWPMGPSRRVLVGTIGGLTLAAAGIPFLAVGGALAVRAEGTGRSASADAG